MLWYAVTGTIVAGNQIWPGTPIDDVANPQFLANYQTAGGIAIPAFDPNLATAAAKVQKARLQGKDVLWCEFLMLGSLALSHITQIDGVFGTGVNGNLVFDGTSTVLGMTPSNGVYTMAQDIFAASITIAAGATLVPGGYRLYVAGTLNVIGDLAIDGGAGGNGSAGVAGTAGVGITGVTFSASGGGFNGGAGGTNAAGTNGVSSTNVAATGGAGGAGGSGGAHAGGSGGTITATPATNGGIDNSTYMEQGITAGFGGGLAGGAGGGGGGSTDGSSGGGGGGGGGGAMIVVAYCVNNTGKIHANGGKGGNAGGSTAAGGGGGGGGGLIVLFSRFYGGGGQLTVNPGAGGSKTSTGVAGSPGLVGTIKQLRV